jgi:nucleoside 2-deoxyribosyltransferase
MSKKQKIYISGKISGIEEEAYKLFSKAEELLISQGYEVVNPFKLNHEHDKTWTSYMRVCIKALCDCDCIYILKNHNESKGALIEIDIAIKLKLEVVLEPMRVTFS